MTGGIPRRRYPLASYVALVALSAWFGAVDLITGLLPAPSSLTARLPFHSPVFGGIALACVVAMPATLVTVLIWRRHPRTRDALTLVGLLLVGWIIVEVAVVREFSPLQPACLLAGFGLILLGDRRLLRLVADVLAGLPVFLAAPLVRRWHLRWGATRSEVTGVMPGDDLVPVSHFTATRAITIDAPPERVWPWIVQVGYRRAGFYSYDLLDNLGRPSAEAILPMWQHPRVSDLAAPMANPPTADTSFRIAQIEPPTSLVWAKPESSWAWTLTALPRDRTRLVTRLKQRYRPAPAALVSVILAEFGDFPMMRKMLLGIKRRAEGMSAAPMEPSTSVEPSTVEPSAPMDLSAATAVARHVGEAPR
jgi:hypothetical protein